MTLKGKTNKPKIKIRIENTEITLLAHVYKVGRL